MKPLVPLFALVLSLAGTAQNRVTLGGVPTNLSLNLANAIVTAHPTEADTLLALMPLSAIPQWAAFDDTTSMDWIFGSGNWLRCTMTAKSWAYLSDDACSHLPGTVSSSPMSLLTTDFDYGIYTGVQGTPYFPWANSSYFVGGGSSFIAGYAPSWITERWQLRTRGWNPTDTWNACAPGSSITPTFNGWLLAKFGYQFN